MSSSFSGGAGATGGATGGWAEYEEEGGWIDELGVDEHDFY
jgi:hypothetical protein